MNAREINPYLESLIRLGFVTRETPVMARREAGIYMIYDVMFDFWFNFVYRNREDIERDLFRPDKAALSTYFGKRFEMYSRDELLRRLPPGADRAGRWWYKDREIDMVAISEKEGMLLLGECKWSDKVDARRIVAGLRAKAGWLDWNAGKRNERFAVVARSFRERFSEPDVTLLDLDTIVKDDVRKRR